MSKPSPALFSVLGALLHYPDEDLVSALPELRALCDGDPALPADAHERMARFLDYLEAHALLTLQENYVALFDRSRPLSLYLFEHVHGESRDRGQAMIDLRNLYESKGLFLSPGELPDYLPVFLEFLSRQPWHDAAPLLDDISHIVTALAERLAERRSEYCLPVGALLILAGQPAPMPDEAAHASSDGGPDIDAAEREAMDAAWQDAPVTFGGGTAGCQGNTAAVPVTIHPRRPAH